MSKKEQQKYGSKFLLGWAMLFCLNSFGQYGQVSNSVKYMNQSSECDREVFKLRGKLQQYNDDYDKEVADLKSGQFCSMCNRSKTAIEKTGVAFMQHIQDVKGQVLNAPPAAYDQAYESYLSKFKGTQEDIKNKEKNCESLRQQAREEQQREQEAAQKKQRDANQKLIDKEIEDAQKEIDKLKEQQAEAARLKKEKEEKDRADFTTMMQNYLAQQALMKQKREKEAEANKGKAITEMSDEELANAVKNNTTQVFQIPNQTQTTEQSKSKIADIISSSLNTAGEKLSNAGENLANRFLNIPQNFERKIERLRNGYQEFKQGLSERNDKAKEFIRNYNAQYADQDEEAAEDERIDMAGEALGVDEEKVGLIKTGSHVFNRGLSCFKDMMNGFNNPEFNADARFNQMRDEINQEFIKLKLPDFVNNTQDKIESLKRNLGMTSGLLRIYLFNQNP